MRDAGAKPRRLEENDSAQRTYLGALRGHTLAAGRSKRLYTSEKQENDEHQHDQPQATAGIVPPTTAIGPRR
jgi:hypothetical protein